jgi:hypothetical protein
MRSSVPVLLVVVMLVTTGCLGIFGSAPSRPPSDQRALNAINRSQAATATITSYRVSIDSHVKTTGSDDSRSITATGSGVVDVRQQRLKATTHIRAETRGTYITSEARYSECPRMGWGRENLTQSVQWLNYTPLGQQLALLARTDVYWRGTEPVNDTEAAVVTAFPTEKELQSVTTGPGLGQAGIGSGNINFQNATVTVWISTKTARILKTRYKMRVSRGGTTAVGTITTRYTDYNEPVTVTRPFDKAAVWQWGCPGSE